MASPLSAVQPPAFLRHVTLLDSKTRLVELLLGGDKHPSGANAAAEAWSVELGPRETQSVVYEHQSSHENATYLVNLTTIGLPDLSSNASCESESLTTTLQLSDGALVVLDSSVPVIGKRIAGQLRRIATQQVKPTLALNVTSDAWRILVQCEPEETFQSFKRLIDNFNEILTVCDGEGDNDLNPPSQVFAPAGSVAFVSIEDGWGFTVPTFARSIAANFDTDEVTIAERLWGDWGVDPITGQWVSPPPGVERGFCQFILKPLRQFADSLQRIDSGVAGDQQAIERILRDRGITFKPEDHVQHSGNTLLPWALQKWLPISSAVMEMVVDHLPPPVQAQAQLTMTLDVSGEEDNAVCSTLTSRHSCESAVVVLASEVEVADDQTCRRVFVVFGRVIAGCLATGQRVRFTRCSTAHNAMDLSKDSEKTAICTMVVRDPLRIGSQLVDTIPAGHTGSFTCEVDAKTTATSLSVPPANEEAVDMGENTVLLLSSAASPVVCVTVLPEAEFDGRSQWLDANSRNFKVMQQIASQDPTISVFSGVFTDPVLAAPDEQRLQAAITKVRAACSALGLSISITSPRPMYREACASDKDSVSTASRVSKSPNRMNRVHSHASTLTEDAVVAWFDQGFTGFDPTKAVELSQLKAKRLGAALETDLQSTTEDPKTVWACSPSPGAVNLLVDHSRGVMLSHPSILRGAMGALAAGVLCLEPTHNLRIDFDDIAVHTQLLRRHPNQLLLAARRAVYAAQLSSSPILQEPVFFVHITGSPFSSRTSLKTELENRSATGVLEQEDPDAKGLSFSAYIAVRLALGLPATVCEATGGLATVRCVFDHYRTVPGDPLDVNSTAGGIVRAIRVEKELPPDVPPLETFDDSKPLSRVVGSSSTT